MCHLLVTSYCYYTYFILISLKTTFENCIYQFITGDVKKHKRNFLQENVRRLKEMKLEKENKLNSQRKTNVQVSLPTLILN